jgi:hypothetical protein
MNAYFYFPAPDPAFMGEGGELRSEKMTVTALRELDIMTPTPDSAAAKPQGVHAGCLQEQFTGPVPARSERSMAEILAERLAEADPDSPCPVFIP